MSRRGKPSGPSQPDSHPSPGQWQGAQYTTMQQVYATHTPSMPIPVPIPSAHSRHTITAPYPRHQVVAAQPMAVHPAVPFGAHAVALQSQFRAAPNCMIKEILKSFHFRYIIPRYRKREQ